ncbi:MAG: hypothetical protein MUO68_07405, partial [Desulfobacteraceae bacterium]|nr:hypothetical protein [Desulfobacteraceae bacterium]
MAINKIKWFVVSVSALSLLMVFWVWPAWNSGSQSWYLGNDSDSTSTMYRNQHPPDGHNDDFVFRGSLTQSFMANEAAMTMLNFGTAGWDYHIEWYRTMAMMAAPAAVSMGDLSYDVSIGRWRNSMFDPFFTAMG